MRNALNALTDELRRLKQAGVKTVPVSDETLAALRSVVRARRGTRIRSGGDGAEENTAAPAREATAGEAAPAGTGTSREAATGKSGYAANSVDADSARAASRQPAAVRKAGGATVDNGGPKLPPAPVVTLPPGDKAARWAALRDLVLRDPTCCANVRAGKKVVLGVGSLDASIMFVGEAPGAEEEIEGEPFVGPAGQLLTKMIQAMGVARSDVYIGNIMNWRPQLPTLAGREQVGNRPPTEEEMRYCLPYLRAQIEVVNPQLIVALGSTAAQGLLGFNSFSALGEIRGKWHEFAGRPLMVTYHPSYILRTQSNRSKRMIWEDLLKVMERAALPISDKQRNFFLGR